MGGKQQAMPLDGKLDQGHSKPHSAVGYTGLSGTLWGLHHSFPTTSAREGEQVAKGSVGMGNPMGSPRWPPKPPRPTQLTQGLGHSATRVTLTLTC